MWLTCSERVDEIFPEGMTLHDALKTEKGKKNYTGKVAYVGHWQNEAVIGHWARALGVLNSNVSIWSETARDWKSVDVEVASMSGL